MTLSEPSIAAVLRAAGLQAPVRFEERTRSTQDTARALAQEGAPPWTTVVAAHQTAGQGRQGRAWDDLAGSLLCSIVLRPDLAVEEAGLLPLLAGAAMAEACEEIAPGEPVSCRWPNDLLSRGGKVGGILVSSRNEGDRLAWAVLGMGVNVEAAPSEVPDARALGAGDALGLLSAFLGRFPSMIAGDLGAAVRARYVPRCATLGRQVRARTAAGAIEGRAAEIGPDGALLVDRDGVLTGVTSGEVVHMEPVEGRPSD